MCWCQEPSLLKNIPRSLCPLISEIFLFNMYTGECTISPVYQESFCFHRVGRYQISFGPFSNLVKIRIESRKENPQKLTHLSPRSLPRHLVGRRTAQKDAIIDITSDSQVNSNFPYRWSPASLTINIYLYPRHLCRGVYSFRLDVCPFVCSFVRSFVRVFVRSLLSVTFVEFTTKVFG